MFAHQRMGFVIHQRHVLEGYFSGGGSHRRINEHRELGNAPLPRQVGQQIQHVLGAAHRKGGNNDVAALPFDGVVDRLHQFVLRCFHALMIAVAVG